MMRTLAKVLLSTLLLTQVGQAAGPITAPVNGLAVPDHRPCMFFSLAGVGTADPVKPGWPWFAVRQNRNGFKELYALILAAKASGEPVTVYTSGTGITECDGYVEATSVFIAP